MQVKSKPGTKCPKEGKPRKYIEDAGFVKVPDTAYYKRLVKDGSLTRCESRVSGSGVKKPLRNGTKKQKKTLEP